MTERNSEALLDADLDLITQFINRQLDPDRANEVRHRIQQDREFARLAAPMLLAWDATRSGRPSRSGEAEKRWDEFTKRADFAHQKRRRIRRNWWILGIMVAVIGLPGFLLRGQIRETYRDWRDLALVAADTGWITLQDGSQMLLDAGATARASKPGANRQVVILQGRAQFRIEPPQSEGQMIPTQRPLEVRTSAGRVRSMLGDFAVEARGDTTQVEVYNPRKRAFLNDFVAVPTVVFLFAPGALNSLTLRELEKGRIVRGQAAVKLESYSPAFVPSPKP